MEAVPNNCEAYFIQIEPKLPLDCVCQCVCVCVLQMCACVSVYLCIIFLFFVIAVILLCSVKVKQLYGRSNEFCMAACEFPALLELN